MKDETNIHWTSDPELVEDFVLDRIEEVRRDRLEKHLSECEVCRSVVEGEKALASAVRLYGREELRQRLKTRLAARPVRVVPWPHIVSAAAVVILVVGLGVYEGWFSPIQMDTPEEWKDVPSSPEVRKTEPGPIDAAGEETREKKEAPAAASDDERRERSVARPKDLDARSLGEAGRMKTQLDERAGKSLVVQPSQKASDENKKGFADRADQRHYPERIWVDGVVLEQPGEGFNTAPLAAQKQLEKADRSSAVAQQKESMSIQSFVVVHRDVRQNINFMQQSSEQMPMEQKRKEKEAAAGRVPTLLERTEDGQLNITVYSDDFIQSDQNVTVSPITVDSLVVGIGGRKIAYRVPGGWGRQQDPVKKTK